MIELQALQTALRAGAASGAARVGPFLITIDPAATGPFRNYAIPDDDAAPTTAEIAELTAFFERHDRLPRLEFVRPGPVVEAALSEAGYTVVQQLPLLVLHELAPVEGPAGIRIARPSTDDELRAVAAMQNAAYGDVGVSDADVARLRSALDSGGDVVAAFDGDTVVGAAQRGIPRGGFAEVYAVATAESHRRRGIATALSAEVSRTESITPFLQAEGPIEQRMYERLGYRPVGELLDVRGPVVADRGAPKLLGPEGDTQLAFLDYLRTGVARKLIGLGEDDARRALVPSGTNLLWLAKHVAGVEAFWLHHVWAGDPEDVIPDDEDLAHDTVGSVLALLRRVGERSAEIVADHPDLDELGRTSEFVPAPLTLRWTLVHLVEETGRHAGHADILRELIDGAAGR